MPNFVTCPSCALKHSARPDGLCPRCHTYVHGGPTSPYAPPSGPAGSAARSADNAWIAGVSVFVLSVALAGVGRVTATAGLAEAALGIVALVQVVAGIWLLVEAFGSSVGEGLLTLCIPCYAFYFLYFKSSNGTLQWLYGMSIVANIVIVVLAPDLVVT